MQEDTVRDESWEEFPDVDERRIDWYGFAPSFECGGSPLDGLDKLH
jgi:hypothetical protein